MSIYTAVTSTVRVVIKIELLSPSSLPHIKVTSYVRTNNQVYKIIIEVTYHRGVTNIFSYFVSEGIQCHLLILERLLR